MTGTPIGSRLVKAAGWTIVGLVATGILRFAARWGSEALFGIEGLAYITAAMSIATIATIPGATGMSAGVTKLVAEQRASGSGRATARTATRAGMIAAGLGAIGAGLYAAVDASVRPVGTMGVVMVAALTLAFAAYSLGKAIMFGFGGSRRYAVEEVVGALLFAAGAAAAWWLGRVELMAAALILAYLPVAREIRVPAPRAPERVDRRTLFGYAAVGTVGSFAGIGFTATTPLAAAALGGIGGAALVGAVLAILEPLNLAPRAVGLVLLPEISRAEASRDRHLSASALKTGTGLVAAVAVPVCSLLLLERDRVLGAVFSPDLVGGATLGWFAMAFLVSVVGAPAVTSLAASHLRAASVSMTASLIGFGIAIALWVSVGEAWGVSAIAFGYFVGSVIQVGIPVVVAWHRFRVPWASQWARILGAMAIIGAMTTLPASIWIDGVAIAVTMAALSPELYRLLVMLRDDS